MPKGAREAALEILERHRRDKAWSSEAIDSVIKKYGLDKREAALASRLSLGVMQNDTLCDYYIGVFCSSKLEPTVRDILRLGVYQILFLDKIPARAAVSESVSLCRSCGRDRAAGLVNAVLRRIAERRDVLPELPAAAGTAEYLSMRYSHPEWLVHEIAGCRGYDFTEAFLAANNAPAKLTAQVNTLKIRTEEYLQKLSEAGIPYQCASSPEGCVEIERGTVPELPGYAEGWFYIQDRAARIAVEIAGVEPGMRVIDACACPGGKSFAAAIKMKNTGTILSCDIHEKKLRLVRSGAERLGIDIIETRAADARTYEESLAETADVVIADVPCSGLGVISKKPEIRRKTQEEIAGLPEIQLAILNNLSGYVKSGGLLLYSTCTVRREENEELVARFLNTHEDFCTEPFALCGIDAPCGMYSFWPNVDGTDGFFAARLRRA